MKPSATNTKRTSLRRAAWLLALLASVLVLAACSTGDDGDDVLTGSLAVDVIDLPAEVEADITVTGPEGAEGDALVGENVTADETLVDLAPGEYTVSADSVMDGDTAHAPTETEQTVTVVAEETAEVTVTYAVVEEVATLNVAVTGDLPEGEDAAVTIAGPDDYSRTLPGADTLIVAPGTYTVTAEDLTLGGTVYDATVDPTDPVTLAVDEETTVTVTYTVATATPLPGEPDTSFGDEGAATFDVTGSASSIHDIETLADGALLLAGIAIDDTDDTESIVLARATADGALDTTFGGDGTGYVTIAGSGTIHALDARVVAEEIVVAAVAEDTGVLALERTPIDMDGTIGAATDAEFTGDAAVFETATDVDVLEAGDVVVAGYGNDNPGSGEGLDDDTDFGIARFDAAGDLDDTFGGSNGVYFADLGGDDLAHGVLELSDGTFVLFGDASGTLAAVHVNAGGALMDDFYNGDTFTDDAGTPEDESDDVEASVDDRFDHDFGVSSAAYAAAETADGDIVFGGTAAGDMALVRITEVADADELETDAQPGYVLDEASGIAGAVTSIVDGATATVTALTVDDGMIYAAGTSEVATDDTDIVLARYAGAGTLDAEFGGTGLVTADFGEVAADAHTLALTPEHALVGGSADGDAAIAAFFR